MRIDLSDSYSTRINVAVLLLDLPSQVTEVSGLYVYRGANYRPGCQTPAPRPARIRFSVDRSFKTVRCDDGWSAVVEWPYIVAFERDDNAS